MPAKDELDPLDRWLNQQVRPLPPPSGTFELITKRARRRKIRKAVVSVAGAAAVAAAIGVAVPVGMSLRLNTSTNTNLAGGSSHEVNPAGSQSALGTASSDGSAGQSSAEASGSGTSTPGLTTPGYLPPNFTPFSVTWDSLSTGWVIGPAGTPGHCGAQGNSSICTSVAVTHNGGQTWSGLPAPTTGGPDTATGVSGLRFLNGKYGWAFGPELWATDDGGENWHKVATSGSSVTDLETINGRAYALFADCTPPSGTTGDTVANCTDYTLKTATAGSDTWTPVGGVPANLGLAYQSPTSAVIELAGGTSTQSATGYFVAPDGTLYAGPLDGTAWHEVAKTPCTPGAPANDGLPQDLLLASGTTASGASQLAMVCVKPTDGSTGVYILADGATTWTAQANVTPQATASLGVPQSLTTLPDGTLILATAPGSGQSSGGIYLLSPGTSQWQAAQLSDSSGKTYGFTYVGMTSATQGVAIGGNPALHAIWMTTDGGQTWQVRPIQK
jgi:hypothetical protein